MKQKTPLHSFLISLLFQDIGCGTYAECLFVLAVLDKCAVHINVFGGGYLDIAAVALDHVGFLADALDECAGVNQIVIAVLGSSYLIVIGDYLTEVEALGSLCCVGILTVGNGFNCLACGAHEDSFKTRGAGDGIAVLLNTLDIIADSIIAYPWAYTVVDKYYGIIGVLALCLFQTVIYGILTCFTALDYSAHLADGEFLHQLVHVGDIVFQHYDIYLVNIIVVLKEFQGVDDDGNEWQKNDTWRKPLEDEELRFQRVEVVKNINKFESAIKHKSNVFSVVVENSNLVPDPTVDMSDDDSKEAKLEKLKQHLRESITQFVRDTCNGVAPVHTQLFDVQFT